MRTVTICRQPSTEWGTFGHLSTGIYDCRTLERPGAGDHPCIPCGTYEVKWTIGVHPKHPEVYEVQNVPGRTAILIHAANVCEQLQGCIAPGDEVEVLDIEYEGQRINHLGITSSRATLEALIADLGKQDFQLIIKES